MHSSLYGYLILLLIVFSNCLKNVYREFIHTQIIFNRSLKMNELNFQIIDGNGNIEKGMKRYNKK